MKDLTKILSLSVCILGAGTIFGTDVNGMRIGVAKGVKKVLIGKVLGNSGGSSETIAKAILWAVNTVIGKERSWLPPYLTE